MREQKLAKSLQALAVDCFPDHPDVQWQALNHEHYQHVTYVDATATPPAVGYPSVRFIVTWPEDAAKIVGCFVPRADGEQVLLFGEDPLAEASSAIAEIDSESTGCMMWPFAFGLGIVLFRMAGGF